MKELYDMTLSLFEALFKLIGDKREWLHYSQTFRASSSIVANIAEGIGQERNRGNAAIRFSSARGSLFETVAWLDIAIVEDLAPIESMIILQEALKELGIELATRILELDKGRYVKYQEEPVSKIDPQTERLIKSIIWHDE